jgi:hypothetical protein
MPLLPSEFYLDLADADPVARAQWFGSLCGDRLSIELCPIERTEVLEQMLAVLLDDECVAA